MSECAECGDPFADHDVSRQEKDGSVRVRCRTCNNDFCGGFKATGLSDREILDLVCDENSVLRRY
jgi:hypothetical protein